jgi:hypothetical protein
MKKTRSLFFNKYFKNGKNPFLIAIVILALSIILMISINFNLVMSMGDKNRLAESRSNIQWLASKKNVLLCLAQEKHNKNGTIKFEDLLTLPEGFSITDLQEENESFSLRMNFPERIKLLDWLLDIESTASFRVSRLEINETNKTTDVILDKVSCYEL